MDKEDGYFGERVAGAYDESSAEMFEPGAVDPVVERLAVLAGSGRALELGIGTGRIALPSPAVASRSTASTCTGDGRQIARQAGRRRDRCVDR